MKARADKTFIDALKGIINRHDAIEEILLFGSCARGSSKATSDIDICIKIPDDRDDILTALSSDEALQNSPLDTFVFVGRAILSLRNGTYSTVTDMAQFRSLFAAQTIWAPADGFEYSGRLNAVANFFERMNTQVEGSVLEFSPEGDLRIEVPRRERVSVPNLWERKCQKISSWIHASIDQSHIDQFVTQFGDTPAEENVARWIIMNLDFYDGARLKRLLGKAWQRIESKVRGSVTLSAFGASHKSTAFAQNVLGKKLRRYTIYDVRTALERVQKSNLKHIVFVDDVAFSGTQSSAVFKRYLGIGEWPENVQELPDDLKDVLRKTKVWFLAGVMTGLAVIRVRKDLVKLGVDVRLVAGREEPFLSGQGYLRYSEGSLLDENNDVVEPSGSFISSAFDDEGSLSVASVSRAYAEAICSSIGRELLTPTANEKGWTEQRLQNSVLGYWNTGKIIAFSHSVPKVSLPVLWCSGTYRGKRWLPLFPGA